MVKLKEIAVAGGYGIVDILAERFDANRLAADPTLVDKPFMNATDLSRAAAFISYIAVPMVTKKTKITSITDTLGVASLPLLEKSLLSFAQSQGILSRTGRTSNKMVLRQSGVAAQRPLLRGGQDTNVF